MRDRHALISESTLPVMELIASADNFVSNSRSKYLRDITRTGAKNIHIDDLVCHTIGKNGLTLLDGLRIKRAIMITRGLDIDLIIMCLNWAFYYYDDWL